MTTLPSEIDIRPFIEIEILGTKIKGLLDSGASISALGNGALELLREIDIHYRKLDTAVRTADGTLNRIVGYIDIPVNFNKFNKLIRFYIAPSLKGKLYLGMNFWKAFHIVPNIVEDLTYDEEQIENFHNLSSAEKAILENIKDQYPSFEKHGLGCTALVEHTIDVGDNRPIKQKFYPISPIIQKLVYDEIDRMLAMDVIEESKSSWSSPVVLVRKPNGKARLCLDSRRINSITKKDAFPLPNIEGLLGRLKDTYFISTIDLKDAFWQVPLAKDSREITAFSVPGRPLYHYKRMPFGLCNSAQTMCRLMCQVIPHQYHQNIFVYLDDLMVISATFSEHISLLQLVAERLKSSGLTINVSKSKFLLRNAKYLGFIVGEGGLRTDPEKVEAIKNFPTPTSIKQTRRLLGMAGWYQKFIPNYSTITYPITNLLKKGNKFKWNNEAQTAFEKLIDLLSSAPILTYPNYNKPFYIRCDASTMGVGSVLYQLDDEGGEHPICFMSKKLNKAQKNYTVTELECLSAVLSIQKFRPFIEGYKFYVITDHSSLKWLMTQKELTGRLARWSLKVQQFNFEIYHEKGSRNVVADALSRVFCDSIEELHEDIKIIPKSTIYNHPSFTNDPDYQQLKSMIIEKPEKFPSCKIEDDHLFIRIDPKRNIPLTDTPCWKMWIPKTLTDIILKKEHDEPNSSHSGIIKTLEKIRRMYYWPKMKPEIYKYINACQICKMSKATNKCSVPPLKTHECPERPWQRIFIDFMGPYPRSKLGNTFLLVVLDHLTKFVLLKPLTSATSIKTIHFLKNDVFLVFGVPEFIISDNGPQFKSNVFQDFLKEFKVTHVTTAYYAPQANASERVNRSVLSAIRSYIKGNHKDWDANINEIGCALRTSIHQSTKYPPYFSLFGYHMITEGDSYDLLKKLNSIGENELEMPLSDRIAVIHNEIQDNLKVAFNKYSQGYNLRKRPISFDVGQAVYIRNHNLSSAIKNYNAKLDWKYIPAIIKKKKGNVMYECCDSSGKVIGIFHTKDIKL